MKKLIKKIIHLIIGEYSPYFIYGRACNLQADASTSGSAPGFREMDTEALASIDTTFVQEQRWYGGTETNCFTYIHEGQIAGICFYWHGERYKTRDFWPLKKTEAKLVQIVVAPEMRGRGIASRLIAFSTNEMARKGFDRLYARIWHSNDPSMKAFERAGWQRIAFVLELNPFRSARAIRLQKRISHI